MIELNIQRQEQYAQSLKEQEEQDRRERELRALELRRLEEEEREERENERRQIIDKLETSNKDAAKVIARTRANALKRTSARSAAETAASHSNSRLLRSRAQNSTVVPDVPHVPFQDEWYAYEDMYVMRDSYADPSSETVRKDRDGIMRAGGYRVEEAWQRALVYAVAGLDIPALGYARLEVAGTRDVVMVSA